MANSTRNKIDQSTFEDVRERFGWCSSWALWSPAGTSPKSGISDLTHFEEPNLPRTLGLLHADVILVGLNISRDLGRKSFSNFHSDSATGQDFKLRNAIEGTPFSGAYMTDIIKGCEEVSSAALMAKVRGNPELEQSNVKTFLDEIDLLSAVDPLVVALGAAAHQILTRNLEGKFRIIRVPHYANYVSQQAYREQVLEMLNHLPN